MKEYRYRLIDMYKILRNLKQIVNIGKMEKLIKFFVTKDVQHHYACGEDSCYYFKSEKIVFPSSILFFFFFFFLRV